MSILNNIEAKLKILGGYNGLSMGTKFKRKSKRD